MTVAPPLQASANVRRHGHVVRLGSCPVPVDNDVSGRRSEQPVPAAARERSPDERRVHADVVKPVADHPQVPPGVGRHRVVVSGRRGARGQ